MGNLKKDTHSQWTGAVELLRFHTFRVLPPCLLPPEALLVAQRGHKKAKKRRDGGMGQLLRSGWRIYVEAQRFKQPFMHFSDFHEVFVSAFGMSRTFSPLRIWAEEPAPRFPNQARLPGIVHGNGPSAEVGGMSKPRDLVSFFALAHGRQLFPFCDDPQRRSKKSTVES